MSQNPSTSKKSWHVFLVYLQKNNISKFIETLLKNVSRLASIHNSTKKSVTPLLSTYIRSGQPEWVVNYYILSTITTKHRNCFILHSGSQHWIMFNIQYNPRQSVKQYVRHDNPCCFNLVVGRFKYIYFRTALLKTFCNIPRR